MPATVNVQTAPRDVESLSKLGRFNLRKLAEELNIFSDEKGQGEFSSGSNQEQAQAIAAALAEADGGGAPAEASSQPIRTPSSKGKTAAKRQASSAATKAPAGGAEGLLAAINKQTAMLEEVKEAIEALTEEVAESNVRISGNNRLVSIACSACLTLAEEVCQAPKAEVLKASIEDTTTLEALMEELETGEEEEGNE
jgi:hypothetical protein